MTVIAVAMLASAVATTAWNLRRDDDDARAATATTVASQVPVAPAASRTAVRRSAPRALPSRPHPAGTIGSIAATTSPRPTVRASHRPVPHHKARPQQPEAQPYGPWQCSQGFAFDLSTKTPLAPKPCQMLGRDIRYQASLTAPGGATGSISISLQDTGSGSIVAGPKTCDGLTFTGDAGTASCGPAPASPPRGHQYAVVMAYRYIRAGQTLTSTAKGNAFTW
jgi:serine/threonine protein kinase, bacterial